MLVRDWISFVTAHHAEIANRALSHYGHQGTALERTDTGQGDILAFLELGLTLFIELRFPCVLIDHRDLLCLCSHVAEHIVIGILPRLRLSKSDLLFPLDRRWHPFAFTYKHIAPPIAPGLC